MAILFTIVGGLLGIIALITLDIFSTVLFGRSVSTFIFGHSGLQFLIAPMVGSILGFICGNKTKDKREQARISREIEQDRLSYENEKKTQV